MRRVAKYWKASQETPSKIEHVAQIVCEQPKPSVNISFSPASRNRQIYLLVRWNGRIAEASSVAMVAKSLSTSPPWAAYGWSFSFILPHVQFCSKSKRTQGFQGHENKVFSSFCKKRYRKTSKKEKGRVKTVKNIPPQIILRGRKQLMPSL